MQTYRKLLKQLLSAPPHPDRTGTGRRSLFGLSITHDMADGFPVLTGKRVYWKGAITEMLWFMSGSTDVSELRQMGTNIWNEWELPDGTIGPGYGQQFRNIRFSQQIPPRASKAAVVSRSPDKVFGLGTYGDFRRVPEPHRALLLNEWMRVLKDAAPSRYMQDSWFCFEHFARDAMKLHGWACKLEEPDLWQLSNRFRYATRYWGADTATWVRNAEIQTNLGNFSHVAGRSETRDRHIDPLAEFIAGLKHDPHSSRHRLSLWNPHDIPRMALPPCHGNVIQAFVRGDYLDLLQHQGSADAFLGLPFNLVGYGFLAEVLARETGLKPGRLQINLGDAHIYENHLTQVAEYLSRPTHRPPTIELDKKRWDQYTLEDVRLIGYTPEPSIAAPVSV